jgi:hypothetical protein
MFAMPKNASLTVRNLSPATKARLARRAKARGRSLEAEVRAILDAAAQEKAVGQADFPDWFIAMIEPSEEDDVAAFLDSRRTPHKPVKL